MVNAECLIDEEENFISVNMNSDDICLNIDTSAVLPRAKLQKKSSKLERVSIFFLNFDFDEMIWSKEVVNVMFIKYWHTQHFAPL